jgi:hypothetical protein
MLRCAVIAACLISAIPVSAVELFRYRYHTESGQELEYVFESDGRNVPKTATDQNAAKIAADWIEDLLPHPKRRT